jgi:RNA polymerase sigma factor (sigma-70 family)
MDRDERFEELMARLRAGDDAAATAVFRQYVHRLIELAGRQFEAWMRDRVDIEDVVQSACKSFFLRNGRGEFELADWEELWSLLARITLRKCANRREYLHAARRDPAREVRWLEGRDFESWLPATGPTPVEAAILNETVEQLFQAMEPEDRPMVEQIIMGCTAEEIAAQIDCSERTVRRVRQRAKHCLQRLIEHQSADAWKQYR